MRAIQYGQPTVIDLYLRVASEDVALDDSEGLPQPGDKLPRDHLGGLLAARCRDHVEAQTELLTRHGDAVPAEQKRHLPRGLVVPSEVGHAHDPKEQEQHQAWNRQLVPLHVNKDALLRPDLALIVPGREALQKAAKGSLRRAVGHE
jgi:hypothetical protein